MSSWPSRKVPLKCSRILCRASPLAGPAEHTAECQVAHEGSKDWQKWYAARHRRPHQFQVGDFVLFVYEKPQNPGEGEMEVVSQVFWDPLKL
jgi:hypothetical protein